MRIVPQPLGSLTESKRPSVMQAEQPVQFAAQTQSQSALPAVPADTLRAQTTLKFGADNAGMSRDQRVALTQGLSTAISTQNADFFSLLELGTAEAKENGERDVTLPHVLLGTLKLIDAGLTRSPRTLGKAPDRMSADEKILVQLVHALLPGAKENSLDVSVVQGMLKNGIQKLNAEVQKNKQTANDPSFAFDQDLLGLITALKNKDGFAGMNRAQTLNFLTAQAGSLNTGASTKASVAVMNDLKTESRDFDAFAEVGGYEEVKVAMKRWLNLLQNPDDAAAFGIKVEKGALLQGPPGTGKTLFARCLAKSVNGGFKAINGADFSNKYLGETKNNIKKLFAEARKEIEKTGRPFVIFIDEIDAIGRRRGTGGQDGASAEMESALNALLSELDGFEENKNLIVIGATNRPEILDPALTRTGRLGTKFDINLPDEDARKAIINVHAKNKPLEGEIDVQTWAELTDGNSGSDIEALLSKAAELAFQDFVEGGRDKKVVTNNDILEAYKTVTVGEKNNASVDPKDLETVVHHETFGHNAVAYALGYDIKIVTSVGRGAAAGYVLPTPGTTSRYEAGSIRAGLADIVMSLAGQAAEEALSGPSGVSYGAHNDYNQARQKITQMITSGMIPGHGTESYEGGYAGQKTQLSREDRELAAFLLKTCRETALNMIKAIPADAKQAMIDESMGGIDYSFGDAMDFNRRHLGETTGPIVSDLRDIFDQHVETVMKAVQKHAEAGAEKYAPSTDAGQTPTVAFSGNNVVQLPQPQGERKQLNMLS